MVLRRSRTALLACTAFIALGIYTTSFAQQADNTAATNATASTSDKDATKLEKIVVKSGKDVKPGSLSDSPLATQTKAETLQKKQVDDLKDFGNTVDPSVSYDQASKSVNVRGLEDDRVLTATDGIPIPYFFDNIYGYGGGADTYDFNSLSSVDVLHSADSSRGGSGILGGAVLLHTLEPEDLITDGKSYGGIVKLGFDGSDRSWTTSGAIAKKVDNTSVLFQASYKYGHEEQSNGDVGGTGVNRTEADPMNYNQRNFLFKIRQELEGGNTIGLTAERYSYNSTKDYLSYSGYGTTYSDYDYKKDTSRDRISLDYKYDATSDDSWIDSAFATFYWQKSDREEGTLGYRLTSPRGTYDRIMESDEKDLGYTAWANSNFQTGILSHKLTFGSDFQFSQSSYYLAGVDSCSTTYVAACAYYHTNESFAPDVNTYKLGVYVEDKIAVGDSPFSLTPGVRFDWYKQDPQDTASYLGEMPDGQSGTHVSPKLRAAYQINPDVELYAQFVTAFKSPNAYQLYVDYDNAPLYRSIGNPDLKPETSWGFEGGANLGDDDFGGKISAFSTRYKNFIDTSDVLRTPGYSFGTYEYINVDNVRISGLSIEGHKKFSTGINLHGSMFYARGTNLDTDELLSSVPPLKAILGIGYEKETWGTDLSLVAAAAVSDKSNASSKPAGYGIVNLTGWWQPQELKGMTLQAGVYNLFNKTYYDALEVKNVTSLTELYSESGRYFKVALSQKF
jgi:hemoglobin/transferrin/lactoferrin receptor protein